MEWGILLTVVGLYGLRFFGFARKFLKNPEPQEPFQRLRVPRAVDDGRRQSPQMRMSLDRFIAHNLQQNEYNEALKRGLISEKVNWKEEGF